MTMRFTKHVCPFCGGEMHSVGGSTSFSGGPIIGYYDCRECESRKTVNSETGTTYRKSGHPLSERFKQVIDSVPEANRQDLMRGLAQGMSARESRDPQGLGPQAASPVGEGDAP